MTLRFPIEWTCGICFRRAEPWALYPRRRLPFGWFSWISQTGRVIRACDRCCPVLESLDPSGGPAVAQCLRREVELERVGFGKLNNEIDAIIARRGYDPLVVTIDAGTFADAKANHEIHAIYERWYQPWSRSGSQEP